MSRSKRLPRPIVAASVTGVVAGALGFTVLPSEATSVAGSGRIKNGGIRLNAGTHNVIIRNLTIGDTAVASVLNEQVKGFLAHAVAAGTVPDVVTWHELSNPANVRTSVARYSTWENQVLGGKYLPININEYAFNCHTSVPVMIQWISAIEESKVDVDIA